jgi:hypothetical protein
MDGFNSLLAIIDESCDLFNKCVGDELEDLMLEEATEHVVLKDESRAVISKAKLNSLKSIMNVLKYRSRIICGNNIIGLPEPIQKHIIHYLDLRSIVNISTICKTFYELIKKETPFIIGLMNIEIEMMTKYEGHEALWINSNALKFFEMIGISLVTFGALLLRSVYHMICDSIILARSVDSKTCIQLRRGYILYGTYSINVIEEGLRCSLIVEGSHQIYQGRIEKGEMVGCGSLEDLEGIFGGTFNKGMISYGIWRSILYDYTYFGKFKCK